MKINKFSLFKELEKNIETIDAIDNCIKITLGPTGKNAIVTNKKGVIRFLNNGSILLKSLEFEHPPSNILLQLFQQAATKTAQISGDGSTTTVIFACDLLKTCLRFLANGYNPIFLSNGLKKISYFTLERIIEASTPISKNEEIIGLLKTTIGKKISPELYSLVKNAIQNIRRDGLVLVEENNSIKNELEIVQGIELDKGFASSYFVNEMNNFEVVYEKPYILISNIPITSLNQIRDIIDYIKTTNKALVLVTEEINKDILSTLVLNYLQKKLKIVVIKYTSIKFVKNGILEDLATLTHSNCITSNLNQGSTILKIEDLGQAEKVVIKKQKSTFIVSKFSKLVAKRRINELNRELLNSDSDYEKSLFKTRIARLSGNITRIKIGLSNQYQLDEERQKIQTLVSSIKSGLEEGILPGGGSFYLYLKEELYNWSSMNLIGEEIFASQILMHAFFRPFRELFENSNTPQYKISQKLIELGYPFAYDLIDKKIVNSLKDGLVDSSKSVRAIIWNSISIISTLITSE